MFNNFEHIDFKNYDYEYNEINNNLSDIGINDDDDEYIIIDNIYDKKNIQEQLKRYICIDYKFFLEDINKGFKNIYEIRKQFKVDFPRCHVYLNNYKVDNYNQIIDYLEYKFGQNITNTTLMFSTQALLALPLKILYTYINLDENFYISELINKKNFIINTKIDNNNIILNASKSLRIIKLSENNDIITKYIVDINLEVNIMMESNILISFTFIEL